MKRAILLFGIVLLCRLQAEEEHLFHGEHFLASYSACDHEAMTNLPALISAMQEAVRASGATILDSVEYVFSPGDGLTMVFLLSESHASIHTYPEYNACFIDLFTCGNNCKAEKFDEALKRYLQPQTVEKKILLRHQGIEEPCFSEIVMTPDGS